jgi:hypothetical protein
MHTRLAAPRLSGRLLVAAVLAAWSCDSTPPTASAPPPGQPLYVSNGFGQHVTVYAAGATGDAAPTGAISSPLTGLTWPGLAFARLKWGD